MTVPVTIATWNLARPGFTGSARNQAILDQIRAINADIWVLTETNESISLDGYTSLATPEIGLRRRGERTTMIWSRWPLRELPVFPDLPETEQPPRVSPSYTTSSRDTSPAVCAIVEVPAAPLLLYGTIITYFGDRGPTGQSKYNVEQRNAVAAHDRDWRRLRAAYPDMPMVVAGDFDATCDARNYPAKTTCTMLRDALEAANLVCTTRNHWIDHICVTPDLAEAVSVAEPWQQTYTDERGNGPKPVSDHQGVHVTIRL